MFGLLGLIQGCLWNTWGPISDTAQLVYGWSNAQIADLALVGNLAYVVLAVPVCYVMDVYGASQHAADPAASVTSERHKSICVFCRHV